MSSHDDNLRAAIPALSRRDLLLGVGAAAVAAAALPARAAAADVIKIGYVSPRSGGMASVVATDGFMLEQARAALKSGLTIGDKTYEVQILDRDTQSDPKRAADLTKSLITQDQVDLVLSSFTPETVNPVAESVKPPGSQVCSTSALGRRSISVAGRSRANPRRSSGLTSSVSASTYSPSCSCRSGLRFPRTRKWASFIPTTPTAMRSGMR